MKKGKSQAQRMKERARSAEHEVAAKDQEIAKLREQLAARNPGPSSTTTPPGRGTPSQRNPASRPQREDRSSQASIPEEAKGEEPDGDSGEGDGDLRGDGDGGDEDAGVRSDSEEEKQEDDDHDMHVMRQLLQDFRDQRLSPDDRQAMMQAAGDSSPNSSRSTWRMTCMSWSSSSCSSSSESERTPASSSPPSPSPRSSPLPSPESPSLVDDGPGLRAASCSLNFAISWFLAAISCSADWARTFMRCAWLLPFAISLFFFFLLLHNHVSQTFLFARPQYGHGLLS